MPEYVASKTGTVYILGEVTAGLKRRETLCRRPVRDDWQIGRYDPTCLPCRDWQESRDDEAMSVWGRMWRFGRWRGVQEDKGTADRIRRIPHRG